jgi:hypothetical protein
MKQLPHDPGRTGRSRGGAVAIRTSLVIAGGLAVAAAFSPAARRRYLTWGATAEEAAGPLPGDGLVPGAELVSTRAITIEADPSAVWPWLVQMGSGRGGAYTYDWIENLFGLNMHSAREILPEFQQLAVGDMLPLGPNGPILRVEICEPERTLAFRTTDGSWLWTFHLRSHRLGTRLVSRNRIATAGSDPLHRLVGRVVMEPGSMIMERRMLLGIKQRAEGLDLPVVEHVGEVQPR